MYPDGRMESQVRITSPQTYKEFSRCILNNLSKFSFQQWFLEMAGSQIVHFLPQVAASDPPVVPLRKSRGERSRSGPSAGMTRINDIYEL